VGDAANASTDLDQLNCRDVDGQPDSEAFFTCGFKTMCQQSLVSLDNSKLGSGAPLADAKASAMPERLLKQAEAMAPAAGPDPSNWPWCSRRQHDATRSTKAHAHAPGA
jgi:hypothetical protein